jgi:MoaA/NifB/PqqE/SkfB family radical SAM enzyme
MTNTAILHPPTSRHPPFSHRRHSPGAMLRCPSCHLNLRQRHPQMTIDYCPRCIARAQELVPLIPARAL